MISLLLCFSLIQDRATHDISVLRQLLPLLAKGREYTEAMLRASTQVRERKAALCYHAAAIMVSARYERMPANKLLAFRRGRNQLDSCINADPQHAEARFIRLTIQDHLPALLGYSANRHNDVLFLKEKLPALRQKDEELALMINAYLRQRTS